MAYINLLNTWLMTSIAQFYFHGQLNDFLKQKEKHKSISYSFKGKPTVKDAIEAIGIPHPEIGKVLINDYDLPNHLNHKLKHKDKLEVFPTTTDYSLTSEELTSHLKFVLDVHLGTLAKYLRMLGFNVLYETDYTDAQIARLAKEEGRIVLTRDIGLLKHKVIDKGYWLRSQKLNEQLKEVILQFSLLQHSMPFTRCLVCNEILTPKAKADIEHHLLPNTKRYFNEFYQCTGCSKIYWKGSHFERMSAMIAKIKTASQT